MLEGAEDESLSSLFGLSAIGYRLEGVGGALPRR
jgi:hypothetical protein